MKTYTYLIIDICIWIPAIAGLIYAWKKSDNYYKQAVIFSSLFMITLSSFCQYMSLIHFHAWYVNTDYTSILNFYLGGAPIEEYLFWWGFGFLMIDLYLLPKMIFDKLDAGREKRA